MRQHFIGAVTALFCFGGLAACTTTPEAPRDDITHLYFIGDSNLDIGRVFTERASDGDDGEIPPPNTVGLRSSNSTILPEFLVERLGIEQTNYAWGGATSGMTNIVALRGMPDARNTGALAQMDEFEAALAGGEANEDALYLVFAGSNDLALVDKTDQAAVTAAIDQAMINLTEIATRLDAAGAEFIVLATRTPRPVLSDADRPEDEADEEAKNDASGRQMNADIRALVAELDDALDADVELFDAYVEIRNIAENAVANGLEAYSPAPENYCTARPDDCDVLVNYDAAHKTNAVHSILADRFIDEFDLAE
ncbi:MAG: hypothetical protein CMK09_03560 [Ponticaulis sp.]|nr:hypothetical protein [Ponticaulis sp.]|tara:strand:+ start:23396 stop:24325 length:930 start_codon:yes stop_codon:yes gene_type:complete